MHDGGGRGSAHARMETMDDRTPERRAAPRHALEQSARVELSSWAELVELYTRDICHGGVFIQTSSPPPIRTTVAVHLTLPDGTGTIRFRGEVVHTTEAGAGSPGFGVQFMGLTSDDRQVLREIVEQAKAAAQTPEAIALAVRGVMRQRLVGRGARPESLVQPRRRRRTSKEAAAVRSGGVVPEPTRPPLRRPERAPCPRTKHRRMYQLAVLLARTKRYDEAAQLLRRAQTLAPDHVEIRVLRCLVLARKAVAARALSQARSYYEDVLRLEPGNATAQEDLIILSALESVDVPAPMRRRTDLYFAAVVPPR